MMVDERNTDGFFIRNKSVFVMGLISLIIAAIADLVAGLFLNSMDEYINHTHPRDDDHDLFCDRYAREHIRCHG